MNKKKKILLISALFIIAIVSIYFFLKGKTYVKASTSEVPEPFTINITEEKMINEYNNIYNVDYMQQLIKQDIEYVYETTALAQIRGEDVTFTNYYSGSSDYKTKNVKSTQGKSCAENNIMAAIINGAGLDSIGYRRVIGNGEFHSSAQLATWEFWNTWVESSGGKENGFEKGLGNLKLYEEGLDGQEQRKIAQEYAVQEQYYANVYFLKYCVHNNVTDENGLYTDNQPNLILIEILDENGNKKEPEVKEEILHPYSNISLNITSNSENIVKVGEEIIYNVGINNNNKEEKQNLILNDKLPDGITFVKVVEIVDDMEVELNENEDYNYNEETKQLIVNIDKITGKETGTITDPDTGETLEYTKNGSRIFRITVKVSELKEGKYRKEIKNIIKVYQEENLLAKGEIINIVSNDYLEIRTEELPQNINEEEECIIGLKITNKGLVNAENVNVKIYVPDDISIGTYKMSLLSETGEVLNITDGTTLNEFERDSIDIPSQKTVYIQLIGTVNIIDNNKKITIEGNVNGQKAYWTTNIQKASNIALEKGGN